MLCQHFWFMCRKTKLDYLLGNKDCNSTTAHFFKIKAIFLSSFFVTQSDGTVQRKSTEIEASLISLHVCAAYLLL